MGDRLDIARKLPGWAEQAAILEATENLTVGEIAERLGVSRQTVSLYRNHHPHYQEIVSKTAMEIAQPLGEQKEMLTLESISAARLATRVLLDGLTAEIDGVPALGHRKDCATALLNNPVIKTVIADEEGSKKGAQAVAAIVLHVERGDKVIVEGNEMIEGEIIE